MQTLTLDTIVGKKPVLAPSGWEFDKTATIARARLLWLAREERTTRFRTQRDRLVHVGALFDRDTWASIVKFVGARTSNFQHHRRARIMQTKGEQCGLVERLLEPDSHDPACPFLSHCYCEGAPHDHVSHPLASEAAGVITELLEALRPFADACNITTAGDNDGIDDTLAARKLTWGDLRRASAAIARAKGLPS